MPEGCTGLYNQLWAVQWAWFGGRHRYIFSDQIMTAARLSYAPSIPLRRVICALHSSAHFPFFSTIQPQFPDGLTIIFSLGSAGTKGTFGESRLDSAK